jgi:hypothetical protein
MLYRPGYCFIVEDANQITDRQVSGRLFVRPPTKQALNFIRSSFRKKKNYYAIGDIRIMQIKRYSKESINKWKLARNRKIQNCTHSFVVYCFCILHDYSSILTSHMTQAHVHHFLLTICHLKI